MHTKPAATTTTTTPANAASVYDLSIAIEFLNTALRALATGHAPDSAHVREPLLWGYANAREVAQLEPYGAPSATTGARLTAGVFFSGTPSTVPAHLSAASD